MPAQHDPSDDAVAEILKKDATNSSARYAQLGLQALLPSRPTNQAPKPNTRFLRNILRETGNHNAALLAKEAEESQARLKRLREKTERLDTQPEDGPRHKRRDREDGQRSSKRRRLEGDEEEDSSRRQHDRLERELSKSSRSNKHSRKEKPRRGRADEESREESGVDRRDEHHKRRRRHQESDEKHGQHNREKERKRHRRREDSGEDHERDNGRKRHERRRRHEQSDEDAAKYRDNRLQDKHSDQKEPDHYPIVLSRRGRNDDGTWRHIRFRSRSSSRSRSPDPGTRQKGSRRRRASPGHSPQLPQKRAKPPGGDKKPSKVEAAASDSDPLEAIVGPMAKAPPQNKIVKFRGRGAFSTTSAIDSHFASGYDPSADVRPNSDEEDEWGLAVEAYRDRQKWKQQGAERLRAAGFTEEQVQKWEKGEEKTEEDVKWAKKGEGREWDRGKVLDEDGDVNVQAEWGRLKGT
ncbi:MAG: hypothetical protein M1822_000945 [Bathelium mastoideum]|nr:MAG: hypothetical protein M1822_000945 [Bathelium mastoideum]